MDTIEQLTDNKKIAIVWYGECGEDCVDYDLTDSANDTETDKIDHIYEIADDQTKSIFYSSYVGHVHSNSDQTLTSLQCGHAYYLVLKKGNDTLNIPNMTLAHAGIPNAGKISQSCAIAPELDIVDLVANAPADLKLKLTVDIDNLIAPCAANTWKYTIITGGENEDDPFDGKEYGPFFGDNTTNVGVPVEVISPAVDVGGVFYKVVIYGVDADGNKITEEPDQEKVAFLPWPSGVFSIVGTVDVDYLEYEGPSPSSTPLTFSGQPSLIDSLHLIKPSLKETAGADTNVLNWQYKINTGAWTDYNDISSADQVEVQYTDIIYWRLKEDLSAGTESDLLTTYNATMVVKYVEKNGTTLFVEKDLLGEVINRRITIREFKDDRDFNASLNITRLNVKRWDYKLEKLNDTQTSVEKTVRDFSSIIATGEERGSEDEDFTINIQSIIEIEGAGYYRVTVAGYHKTDNTKIVTDVLAVEKAFFNWPVPTFAISSTGANTDTVDVFYREYEGPSSSEPLVLAAQTNVASVEFTSLTNSSSWYYGLDATANVTPLPVNPTNIDATNKNNINFILKEDQKANGTIDVAYDSDLKFTIKGKDTLHKDATGTTLNPTITIKGHVKERITNIDTLVIQSSDPNANTINLRATFDLVEINRYTYKWIQSDGVDRGSGSENPSEYNSSDLTKDLLLKLNDEPNNTLIKFKIVGKHSDANNNVVNESGWIAGQVAESDEKSITVEYPDPTFAVTASISDGYKEREESSRGTSPKVKVTTFHWMDHSEDITFTGPSDSIWEYKKSDDTEYTSVSDTPVVVTKSEEIEVRVKEGKLVSDNGDEILNWSAKSLDGTTKTATTKMTATMTEGVALPGLLWLGFAGTDVSANYHFSDWFEMVVSDYEEIKDFTVTGGTKGWNESVAPNSTGHIVADGDTFDKNKHVVTVPAGSGIPAGIYTALTGTTPDQTILGFATTQEMIDALHGNVTWTAISGFGTIWKINGQSPLAYTKLTIKDHTAMTTALSGFGGANLAYIAMVDSPTKPNATGDGANIFGTGKTDLSCIECGSTQPLLKVVEQDKTHIYQLNTYKSDNSCNAAHALSLEDTSNWKTAPGVYNTSNTSAPLKQNQFIELYFENSSGKLKLADLGC